MDWKRQFKVHDLSFRDTCIILLVITVNLFILMVITSGPNPEAVSAAYRANCASNQGQIYKLMGEVTSEEGFELPPEWTVADLIQEAIRKDFQEQIRTVQPRTGESVAEMGHRLEKEFLCRSVHYGRKCPYLRRKRTEVVRQYLVFPVPASAVLDGSLLEPVPILMCPPGAHGKRGSNVLYSDGSVKKLTTEEAEKLVAEQSPVPLEIDFEVKPEEGGEAQ